MKTAEDNGGLVPEEYVDMKDAVTSDPIVGIESTTLTEHGPGAREPVALPSPNRMTPVQLAKHWLTHLPYHPGCELCVQSRRPNSHHRSSTANERTIPLLVGDYCFPKSQKDDESVTVLVLKLFPYKLFFACAVRAKGPDPLVVARLAQWMKDVGLENFAYRSDREPSIVSMLEEACARAGRRGVKVQSDEPTELPDIAEGDLESGEPKEEDNPMATESVHVGVPEHSHPGESQSNGKAERAVGVFEDQLRTYKAAYEARFKMALTSTHPVMAWIIEHTVHMLNKYSLGADGRTAWGRLHGQ